MSAAKKLALVQGTPEWLETRYNYLTASQVPVILNQSDHETPLGLFEEKIMRKELRDLSGKEILFARGHNAEERGREYLKGKGLVYEPAVVVSDRYPDFLASLDGLTADGQRMFEHKFVGKDVVAKLRSVSHLPPQEAQKHIPADHFSQIQTGLMLSEAKVCDYFVSDPSGDSHWMEIFPETEYQAFIEAEGKKFMECVRSGTAPEPGERDFKIVDDERFKILTALKAELDNIQGRYDAVKDEIVKSYKDERRVKCGAVTIVKSMRRGNIDYSKVPSLRGVDLEKYRKASTEVVTVKVGKEK